MFIYTLAKAYRKKYLGMPYLESAIQGYRGVIERLITIDKQGLVNLENTCAVAGLGGTPYRDGSYEYYVGEKIRTNDYKGVGAFILASLEINQNEHAGPSQ